MPQAILFDHDGTLVDSEPSHLAIWNEVLEPLGVTIPEPLYKDLYAGMPTPANAVDIAERFGLDVAPAELAERKAEATRAFLAARPFPLMPGTREVLDRLQAAGLRLAVVTGAARDATRASLAGHGILDRFETVVTADDVAFSKPAPDCYLLAARQLGVSPSECVAIEDSEHGLQAAADADVPCVVKPTPMSAHHDFARATVRVDDLHAAAAWILARAAA